MTLSSLTPARKKGQFDSNWPAAVEMRRKNKLVTVLHPSVAAGERAGGNKTSFLAEFASRMEDEPVRTGTEVMFYLVSPGGTPNEGFQSPSSCGSTEREAEVRLAWLPIP